MKIHIELKKKRYILYAAIIALLGVVGANISSYIPMQIR